MTAHTTRGHAKLSPSASHRWMECPGSIRKSESIPRSESAFADEGTAAHMLAQHCMETGFDADRFADTYIDITGETPVEQFLPEPRGDRCFCVDDEMAEGVQTYLDHCREIAAGSGVEAETEQWLSLEHLGVPGLDGGTGDFVAYDPKAMLLDVVDFKYGRGVAVDPQENPQGLCYTLGALRRFHNRGIKRVRVTIVQPRCPHPAGPVRTWDADVIDILDFETELVERAKRTMAPDAELKPGPWCRFCPAAATCEARRARALEIAQAEFGVVDGEMTLPVAHEIAPEKLAGILREIDQVEDWCRRVREFAHAEATHGRTPPGFKLVAKRAVRRWKNEQEAAVVLRPLGDAIWTEPELKTPAQVEPLMPGKNKTERAAKLDALVSKESSGTVLVPEHDTRPAVRADASEFGAVDG